MRKVIVTEFMSLDGVIQAPGGPAEDPSDGFALGGWQVPYSDESVGRAVMDLYAQPFDLLLGRRTYDIWAAYWPRIGATSPDHPIAGPFNSVRKYVATHRPGTLEWQNSHALDGDPATAVRALQRGEGGNLLTHGSGELVRQLLASGLVDELRLLIYPLLLGHGRRLFADDAQASEFTLSESTTTPDGVLITRYVRSGEVRTGTFVENGE